MCGFSARGHRSGSMAAAATPVIFTRSAGCPTASLASRGRDTFRRAARLLTARCDGYPRPPWAD